MDDQQKEKISNNPETDCWILRDSKSNPGHKYYYNPFTKQKLWRHSDEEIKKKQSKAGNTLDNDLNNAQTEKHLHTLKTYEEASTSDTKVMDNVQSMNHFKIWDIPIIPPTIPLIQQAFPILCNSLISPSNPIVQLGLQSSFNAMSHMHSISGYAPNFNTNNYPTSPVKTNSQQGSEKYSPTNTIDYNMDLRSALRNKRFNKNYTNNKNNFNAFKEKKETVSWDEEKVKVILPFLRSYATPDAKPDSWYIVPDTHVVINHSRLLNQMTVLDDKRCRLKIPPIVSMELRNPENNCDEAISRFVRFHCTEIYSESEVKQDVQFRFNNILNTCLQLTMDNYHVVLLCSKLSERLFKYKLNTPVFTVEKLIELQNQGRLLPRYSKTVPKQAFNNGTKNDIKDIETTPFPHIADSSAQSSFTRQVLNPESQFKWQAQKESHHETLVNNITPEFDDAHQLNSKAVASSNNNLCLFKTAKKRIIKLKGTCEESLSNCHPSKRKRWSAVKNINRNQNSTCEESAGKDDEVISTISENALSKSNVQAIEHEIRELSKGNDIRLDELAKNCLLVNPIEKPSNIDIEKLKHYRDKSTSPASFVYTSDIFTDCGFNATDQTEFNSLPVTVYGWLPKFVQILEKVLMEILGQNSTVGVKENSHLQRLRSATLDIIKNFCHCSSIVDAANKLSMKIKQLFDSGGEIQSECFFEDIYRYGVNLVELLQEISPSLEYILNAKILLEKVRNDSMCSGDSTQNVSDKTDEKVLEDNEYMKENDIAADSSITTPECTTIEKNTSNKKINVMCRLSIRNLDQINDQKNVDMVNDQAQHKLSIDYNQNKNSPLTNMQPKIYLLDANKGHVKERNVVVNSKLINNLDDTSDENENSFECNAVCETAEQNDLPAENKSSNITNNSGSKIFEHFIEMFSKEIRKSLMLCANNFKMYITENLDDNDLRPKIQGVQTHLSNMQRELDSILQRESGDINNRFENLLKRAGIDINIDQNMCDEYRNMVRKCRNEVNEFLMSF